ncbi:DsbA family protein [Scytonema sp. NUACC26]|uniref:DsbA family protein n=1 Tax=Scytonema sp. NUACC26 TaxID=3140176 RepID=UPI0034DC09C2
MPFLVAEVAGVDRCYWLKNGSLFFSTLHYSIRTLFTLVYKQSLRMSDVIPNDAPGSRNQLVVPPSEQDHRQGSLNARVVLVEYGDYQCPQCGELYTSIKAIQRQLEATLYGRDSLCFVFRHFPQPQIHPQAQKAALATEAAGAQGQFWQMYEILLEHQQELGNGYLAEYADRLGLNVPQFLRDIARRTYLDRINQDIESGIRSGAIHAPALFINGTRYRNALKIEPLLAAIVESGNFS